MKIVELNKNFVVVEEEPKFSNKFSEIIAKLFKLNKVIRIKYEILELVNGSFVYYNEFGVLKKLPHLDSLILSKPNNPFIKIDKKLTIPKGWFVAECGQSPLHFLWYVNLVNFNEFSNGHKHPRQIFVEEFNTFEDALTEAINQLNKNS